MLVFNVPPDIAFNFRFPICLVRARESGARATVHMPEATIYKNNRAVFRQHNIRLTWITLIIFAKAEPMFEQKLPNNLFRLGVNAANMGHILAARIRRLCICHGNPSQRELVRLAGIICTIPRQLDIRYPNLPSVPTFILVSGDFIHGKHQNVWILIA